MSETTEHRPSVEDRARQGPPPAKPKPRAKRLRKLLVVHHATANTKLYAAISKRFASNEDYICRFFDTQENAEAYAAELGEPVAIFLAKPIAETSPSPTENLDALAR